jgi:kumamolisin
LFVAVVALTLLSTAHAVAPTSVTLTNSVQPVAPVGSVTTRPFISRSSLTTEETAAPVNFEISLKMRNYAELQSRIQHGEQVSPAELASRYEPTAAAYQKLLAWAKSQNLKIVRQDDRRLVLFLRGSVAQVSSTLGTSFARVKFHGQEYTSAVTAPSIPGELSDSVLGINGLQPHLHVHKHLRRPLARKAASGNNGNGYFPSQVAAAYNATALYNGKVNGTGETIAIVIDTFPYPTDLQNFWTRAGVPQSLSNIQFIQAVSGTLDSPSGEETLDTEWASGMAPGAKVRVYASLDLYDSELDQTLNQVLSDVSQHPEDHIHELTMSFGIGESDTTQSEVNSRGQIFSELAARGVSIFASSGDDGSTPNDNDGEEDGPLQVENPADDPSVTGVGGTTLKLDSNNSVTSETVWNSDGAASGGGISSYFSRPTWQTGTGVNASSFRQVPDIAAAADPNYGGYIYFEGSAGVLGGTSLASPICAGLCALANEAVLNSGASSTIGALNPHIYPQIGTSDFRDITVGNNETPSSVNKYVATTGYDLCTGVGAPLMQAFTRTLVGSSTLNGVAGPVPMLEVAPGATASFTVSAAGSSPTYQWQHEPEGSSTFSNLADSGTYTGSTQSTLAINNASATLSGDNFRCRVTFGSTTITSPVGTLVIQTPLKISTLAGTAGDIGTTSAAGSAARFNYPSGVALDSSGNIYVADDNNNQIRKITPAGVVSTPFGNLSGAKGNANGTGNNATFTLPNAVCIDSSDNIYVADSGNNVIRKITGTTVTTYVGVSGGLSNPNGVAVDGSGNIYIADTGHDTIRKVTPSGSVSILAGITNSPGDQDGDNATFNAPEAVAVTSDGSAIYVADYGNFSIRKITSDGYTTTVAGTSQLAGYQDGLATQALFNAPTGVALDSAGNLYITDSLVTPTGVDQQTGLVIVAAGNEVVRKLSTSGIVTTVAGDPAIYGSSDGTGTAAQFYSVQAVTVATSGDLILADTYNQTVRIAANAGPIALSSLTTTYNGSPQQPTVTTTPAGLSYVVTYNGSSTVPTAAGTYTVVATLTANGYSGSATGTLVINPANATVTLTNLDATYDGSPQAPTVNTSPPGLATQVLFNNTSTEPTNAGVYTVTATITDPNYTGTTSGQFQIAKAIASVNVDGQSEPYTGSGQGVTPVTTPAGLGVTLEYNGSSKLPVAPGSYSVTATIHDTNYMGSGGGTFTITKNTPTVAFTGVSGMTITAPYNGKTHPVTVTTTPSGIPATYIYTNSSQVSTTTAPTLVGTYTVMATVSNADYSGSLTGTIIITPINPVIGASTAKPGAQSATVTGTVSSEGDPTTTVIQYGPAAGNYTASVPGSALSAAVSAGTTTAVLSPLTPKTMYHYRVVATNDAGTVDGPDKTFATLAAPILGTTPQTLISATGAEIGLQVTPNGYATTVYFKYGTSTAYGSTTAVQSIGSGSAAVNVYALFPQLAASTTYDYQVVVTNATGTYTENGTFTTAAYDTTIVASTGSVAPNNASGTTTFASLGNAIVNSADGVAFKGTIAGTGVTSANATGIWADLGDILTLVAQTGTTVSGTGPFSTLSDPLYNNSDAYAFIGALKTGVNGVTSANANGIYATSGGVLQLVARQAAAAPDAGGATFAAFSSCALDENGDVIFGATLTGTGVTTATNAGIWEGTPGSVALMLRNGQLIDNAKTIASFSFLPAQTVVNGQTREFSPVSGDLACNATFTDKTTGIVDVVSGTAHLAVTSGVSETGLATGETFASFSHPAINDSGNLAFAATLTLNAGGVSAATSKGIWTESSGTLVLIAQSGSGNAPGATAPFVSFSDPVYNSNEDVAFVGTLSSGSGVWHTAGGSNLVNVAMTGTTTTAPGCPTGAHFATFTELALNDAGGVAFLATLTPNATAGVTSANTTGIWAVDNTGTLSLIARTGDTFNGKTVTALSFLPNGTQVYGQSRSFDRTTGDLVYGVTFSDKTTAICNVVFP